LVLTEEEYFDSALISGFRNFCETNHYDFQVLDGLEDEEVEQGQVYLTMDDADLVSAIKSVQNQGFELGKQVGIISLNDSCYKEILAGGISIISSKPKEIGKLAADLIQSGKRQNINVSMEMILRKSL
jgi:DNA-binding LacI/PurR family transcriptional regulator